MKLSEQLQLKYFPNLQNKIYHTESIITPYNEAFQSTMRNKPNAMRVLLEEAADANQRSGIVGMAALQFGTI